MVYINNLRAFICIILILFVAQSSGLASAADSDGPLPRGVKAVWGLEKAFREKTPTRERMCINGLWRWQPAKENMTVVPSDNWGYFKVPGSWPGITSYMQKDSQNVYHHQKWNDVKLEDVKAAWYQREIVIPESWVNRRIWVSAEYLNSYAAVYVDGRQVGEIRFPGGEVDLTAPCRAGGKYVLTMLVVAMPLNAVMHSYNDTASARKTPGFVARRGLCGDVYLSGVPSAAHIGDVKVDTSVRRGMVTVNAMLKDLGHTGPYRLRALIIEKGRVAHEFTSMLFRGSDLKNGRFSFSGKWKPQKLWDIHTPQNVFHLQLSLLGAEGKLLDTAHDVRFGFREFWIDGRDFFLNGSRIFLSSVPLDNAQVGAASAHYSAARESLLRLKSFGINMVYTHNYGCEPGSHLSFAEILKAADDVGMLVSFSQPHFGHYEWTGSDAEKTNGYARHAEFYVKVAQNHPSVVMYSMSHNGTGYSEDMNPDLIDGINSPRNRQSLRNAKLALRAERIVSSLDPGRVIYHHSSGNLGSMHTSNFYPNFAPIQEISDWFEHWATSGVKPLFTCEYGAPFSWDWAMYRGWYRDKRAFGDAKVPWEFCMAEWNSQFLGDRAFKLSPMERDNLRWEAKQFKAGNTWHRWDYPYRLNSREFDERYPVFAMYLTDNWRAFRTWGVSANSPWDHGRFWKPRDGVDRRKKEFAVDWDNLQRPGFSADYEEDRYERMDLAFEREDWIPTAAAQSLLRNNQPLLAYIGGKPSRFTSKDHNFFPGETVEKQIIVINNSRETVSADCQWTFNLPHSVKGIKKITVRAGEQERIPLRFALPAWLAAGEYKLSIAVRFSTGEVQDDSFAIHVVSQPSPLKPVGRIALFDPKGETGSQLRAMGITYEPLTKGSDLAEFDILIIGKGALTRDGHGPDIGRVRDGLKVVVFEQTREVLEERLGFRVTEYGLRQAFQRVADHPVLKGVAADHLRDWRGEATILPSRMKYELSRRYDYAPTVHWCGLEVTRLWRCGNRGNVASVLIEKPHRGDFLPIVDGGFSLQFSPLMEYREGKGMILFCQMDVTGRTEKDPAAARLIRNIIRHAADWKPTPAKKAVYVGDTSGKSHLELAGMSPSRHGAEPLSADHVLIIGPGGGTTLTGQARAISEWLTAGGHLLAIGLDEREANVFLPEKVHTKRGEHISAFFQSPGKDSLFAGIGPADTHNRDPRDLNLVSGGASIVGNGVLAKGENTHVAFCQLAPWNFDYSKQNTKRTYRRTSFLVSRILANMGVRGSTPLLQRFGDPLTGTRETRWLKGLYLDSPEEWDDPYRFFRW